MGRVQPILSASAAPGTRKPAEPIPRGDFHDRDPSRMYNPGGACRDQRTPEYASSRRANEGHEATAVSRRSLRDRLQPTTPPFRNRASDG